MKYEFTIQIKILYLIIPSYFIKAVRAEGSGVSEINDDEDYSDENYEDEKDNGNKKS